MSEAALNGVNRLNRQVWRGIKDRLGQGWMLTITSFCCVLVVLVAIGLVAKSWPILSEKPLGQLLGSSAWSPNRGEFGFLPFLVGTLWVTGVAMLLAAPLSLLTSIYLSEYAHRRVRAWAKPLIDVLAGIPSVVYGVWGILVLVPLVKDHIAPLCHTFSSGYTTLTAGLVLAVMVFPVIINVTVEVFATVPRELREASLALGATQWQTVKHVVLRKALPGIIAANILGLSRAFGETMAVLMVAGNVPRLPHSVLDPSYPLPALIANNYGEMMSIPLYDSALLLAALVLFVVVVSFNLLSRIALVHVEKKVQ